MKNNKIILLIVILTFTFSISLNSQEFTIHCGKYLDVINSKLIENKTIYINDGKISDIKDGFTEVKGELIDLKDKTLLPGLMDMHVHLHTEHNPNSYSEKTSLNPEDYALRGAHNAKKTLMTGFTTVRDLLSPKHVNLALKKAINSEIIEGPRIIAAAGISTTGGHFDPTNGICMHFTWDPEPIHGIVNGKNDIKKAVRQAYKDGYDMIKVAATGGVLSVAKSGDNPQFTQEEMNMVIEMCEDYNFLTAAHAHGEEGMFRAVKAGINSVEHGTYMSDRIIKAMIEKGTYYVPTITAGKFVEEKSKVDGYFPDIIRLKAAAIGPQIHKTFETAFKNGVKIAFGTDSGVSPHGENWKEFVYMVEAGMSEAQAIQSATIEAAKLIRMEKELGSIDIGKIADIIAVDGNPLEDINLLSNVSFVMKEGKIFKK